MGELGGVMDADNYNDGLRSFDPSFFKSTLNNIFFNHLNRDMDW